MRNVLDVAIVQCEHHLVEDDPRLFFRETTLVDDFVEELSSSAHLSYHIYVFLVLKCLVKLDDVGMVQLLQDLDFIQKL